MLLLVVEVVFALVLVAGVAFVYWPAALIVLGALGVLVVEKGAAARVVRQAREDRKAGGPA